MTPTSEVIRLAREAGIRFGEFDVPFEDRKVTRTMGAQPIENIARLISLAKAEALAEGWLDMDSAPTDGTLVLGYGFLDGEINGRLNPGKPVQVVMAKVYGTWQADATDAYSVQVEPIKWRPLPPPPKEAP